MVVPIGDIVKCVVLLNDSIHDFPKPRMKSRLATRQCDMGSVVSLGFRENFVHGFKRNFGNFIQIGSETMCTSQVAMASELNSDEKVFQAFSSLKNSGAGRDG